MNFAMNAKNFFKKNMISKNCFGVLDITMAIFKKFAEKKFCILLFFLKKRYISYISFYFFIIYYTLIISFYYFFFV
ncbi:hypothetical protein TZ01_04370 [Acidiplasma sp. MBA-1]|nr:hypothetical protein TZ01_04370 [Acidiplasma sp. MBA-1]